MPITPSKVLKRDTLGSHAPLFERVTTPEERRQIQAARGRTFLLTNPQAEDGTWAKRELTTIRAHLTRLNEAGTFWCLDARAAREGRHYMWLSWNPDEVKRRRAVRASRRKT